MSNRARIKVLFMASEADPLVKVGGLGDVAGSLPRSIREVSTSESYTTPKIDIRLVIPFHPDIKLGQLLPQLVAEYQLHPRGGDITARVFEVNVEGLPVFLLAGPPIDQESGVYSANLEADGFKYVFFSLAALELARQLGWTPDILHANDWHTAAAVYSLAVSRPFDPFFRQTASMLTIHNLPYLGAMTSTALDAFGLPAALNTSLPAWANHMALPLGLLTADAIVAVSPGYSKEILTAEFGSGLQDFLKARLGKISGILNGLDTSRWDPAVDPHIPANFTADAIQSRLVNKAFLQKELELECDPRIPLVSMVTRMEGQKGVDLAVQALRLILQSESSTAATLQAVFLGTGNPAIEGSIRTLEQDYPQQVRARILYDEVLSRHIYAGADMLLMPSRYEPCGLSQMIAMHYGCLPIAHATGGLSDTIQDPSTNDKGTGYLFKPANPDRLAEAIQRALDTFLNHPAAWQEMQLRGMQQDFSWDRSALDYIQLYQKILRS